MNTHIESSLFIQVTKASPNLHITSARVKSYFDFTLLVTRVQEFKVMIPSLTGSL